MPDGSPASGLFAATFRSMEPWVIDSTKAKYLHTHRPVSDCPSHTVMMCALCLLTQGTTLPSSSSVDGSTHMSNSTIGGRSKVDAGAILRECALGPQTYVGECGAGIVGVGLAGLAENTRQWDYGLAWYVRARWLRQW